MSRPSNTDSILAAVQLVQKKPRTIKELAQLLGLQGETCRRYLCAMEREGLVSRSRLCRGLVGCDPYLFTWVREAGQ